MHTNAIENPRLNTLHQEQAHDQNTFIMQRCNAERVRNVENYQGSKRTGRGQNLSFLHPKGRTQKPERVHTKVATLQRNTLRRVATDNGGGKGLLLKLS